MVLVSHKKVHILSLTGIMLTADLFVKNWH